MISPMCWNLHLKISRTNFLLKGVGSDVKIVRRMNPSQLQVEESLPKPGSSQARLYDGILEERADVRGTMLMCQMDCLTTLEATL